MSEEIDDHIERQYYIRRRLGKGAYGIVWKATDRKSEKVVALKKIFDAFRNETDAQRTYREIMLLQELRPHPNIVKLLRVVKASGDRDIYLIFEYMDTDLHNVIKKRDILRPIHVQFITYQLFCAVLYLHSANVIHRDLKPSNVLLDVNCTVKLADFGLARSLTQVNRGLENSLDSSAYPELTEYVATRWYRAPEILLAAKHYTKGVDMWSLGCIIGEMLSGKPLFPGTSTINQIERIVETVPRPTKSDIDSIKSKYASSVLEKMLCLPPVRLEELVPNPPFFALDLMKHLLLFNPNQRLSIERALQHPYVRLFYNSTEQLTMTKEISLPLDDDVQLSVSDYRNKLYEFIERQDSSTSRNGNSEHHSRTVRTINQQMACARNRALAQPLSDGKFKEGYQNGNSHDIDQLDRTARAKIEEPMGRKCWESKKNYMQASKSKQSTMRSNLSTLKTTLFTKEKGKTNGGKGVFLPFLPRTRSVELKSSKVSDNSQHRPEVYAKRGSASDLNRHSGNVLANWKWNNSKEACTFSSYKQNEPTGISRRATNFCKDPPTDSNPPVYNSDWGIITSSQLRSLKELTRRFRT
uniref:Mitogen-activated protein kinase n=1 Tax=Trichuris muris TaxID=70415 RepID=A0A5S6QLU7_TRIMR